MFYTDTKPRAPLAEYDQGLVWTTMLLLGLGLVMVYSASIAIAEGSRATGYQPTYFLMRHGLFVAVGVVAAVIAFQVPLRLWQQAAPYLFLLGAGLLVLVLVPGVGREVNGSQRWISLQLCHPAALRVHETVRRALRRRLHGAQGGAHGQLPQGFPADVRGDAGASDGCCCANPTSAPSSSSP